MKGSAEFVARRPIWGFVLGAEADPGTFAIVVDPAMGAGQVQFCHVVLSTAEAQGKSVEVLVVFSGPGREADVALAREALLRRYPAAEVVVAHAVVSTQIVVREQRPAGSHSGIAAVAVAVANGTLDDIESVDVDAGGQAYRVGVSFSDGHWRATITAADAAIRFELPAHLLRLLRARRAATTRKRAPEGQRRKAMSMGDVFRAFDKGADVSRVADDFVGGMESLQADVEAAYDAFLLDPGMGPMVYLCSDGRILLDNRTWDGDGIVFETSLDRAIMALVAGAEKTGLDELLELVPRLVDGVTCPWCGGTRSMTTPPVVCLACYGRGEIDEALRRRAEAANLPLPKGGQREDK